MAKDKRAKLGVTGAHKGKKEKAFIVNKIIGQKSKTKTVSTNLKKLTVQTKASTEKADDKFKAVQGLLAETAKTSTQKPNQSSKKKQKKTNPEQTSVDMDTTMEEFSKL